MKYSIVIDDVTHDRVIKSRQAIEILNIVEKAGLFASFQKKDGSIQENLDLITLLPKMYLIAHEILAIALGEFKNGVITRNEELADNLAAVDLPMYAIDIVKTLLLPVTYSLTDDRGIADEKKKGSDVSEDTSLGKKESSSEPVA